MIQLPIPADRTRRGVPPLILAVGSAIAVAVLVAAGLWAWKDSTAPVDPLAQPAPASRWAPPPSPVQPSPVRAGPAQTELQEITRQDRSTADGLVGYWLPQLSSKASGMAVGSSTYDDSDIVAMHRRLADQYGDVILVRSDEYSTFSSSGYWVTLANRPFSDAAQANAWCDARSIPPDDCFAKRLSHDLPPQGSTIHRGSR